MTALAADIQREYSADTLKHQMDSTWPVVASDIIYEGAVVVANASGNAKPNTATTNEKFIGFAAKQADNSAGGAGAIDVTVYDEGHAVLAVTGATAASVGEVVYAGDDNAFSLAGGTDHQPIGKVARFIGADGVPGHVATSCLVYFQGFHRRNITVTLGV